MNKALLLGSGALSFVTSFVVVC